MASKIKLSGQEVRRLKNDRQACSDIQEDLERALKAGVPGLVEIQEKLDTIIDRIEKLLILAGEDNK
jgi:hypothetical protein